MDFEIRTCLQKMPALWCSDLGSMMLWGLPAFMHGAALDGSTFFLRGLAKSSSKLYHIPRCQASWWLCLVLAKLGFLDLFGFLLIVLHRYMTAGLRSGASQRRLLHQFSHMLKCGERPGESLVALEGKKSKNGCAESLFLLARLLSVHYAVSARAKACKKQRRATKHKENQTKANGCAESQPWCTWTQAADAASQEYAVGTATGAQQGGTKSLFGHDSRRGFCIREFPFCANERPQPSPSSDICD